MTTARSKFLILALITSLGVNLAIGGFFVGRHFWHGEKQARQAGLVFDRRAALSNLDEEHRKNIKSIWKENRPKIRNNFRSYRAEKQRIAVLLAADPLDKRALEEARRNLIEYKSGIELTLYSTLTQMSEALPPELRKSFFERGFRRRHTRHHRKD